MNENLPRSTRLRSLSSRSFRISIARNPGHAPRRHRGVYPRSFRPRSDRACRGPARPPTSPLRAGATLRVQAGAFPSLPVEDSFSPLNGFLHGHGSIFRTWVGFPLRFHSSRLFFAIATPISIVRIHHFASCFPLVDRRSIASHPTPWWIPRWPCGA